MQTPTKIVAVVDDDPGMLRAIENLLGAHGFVPKCFASAEDFLDRGAAMPLDCLVLDIRLDGMSGIEMRRRLKVAGSTLPVIFMTALEGEGVHAQAQKAGCAAYLRKPFPPSELIEAIEKAAP